MDYNRYSFVSVKKDGKVLIVTMNRPEAMNAIRPQDHNELEDLFLDITRDEDVNAVVLTGAGKGFCSGGDVKTMNATDLEERNKEVPLRHPSRLINNLISIEQPVIAAVNGPAVGLGATIALFCDVIFAADTAKIGDPHVRVGLVAGDGGAVIWPLLCGLARAKEYLMTGDLMTAAEAERIGLVNHVVPANQLMPKATEFAQRLANGPTRAIRWTKLAANKALRNQVNLVLDASLGMESLSFFTEDHKEAAKAFVEKRAPKYKGY